jgi:cobalt-zinc-cadmium efflux system outer membrane protein
MSKAFLRAAVLVAALLPPFALAAPLSLDRAIAIALQRSETARSGRAGVASADELSRAAGQFADPTLRVALEDLPVTGADRFRTARDSMTTKRIGLSQEWLSSDKRAARQAAADATVNRETVMVQVALADTRLQTTLAYLDAYYAGEALKLTTLMEHHAHEELEASRARLASAAGSSQEVLALTGANAIAEDDSAEVRQQQSAANVALERWVGVHPDELAPVDPVGVPPEASYVARHPTVMTFLRDTEVAERAAKVASTNRNPSWSYEVGYAQRTGFSDLFTVGVSIPFPVARGQRQDRETASKLALVEKADADLAEAVRAATAEYRSLVSNNERLRDRIERYRSGVVTVASQRTAAATAGYRSNQTSLTTLFEARHAEVEVRRKLLLLERDLAKTEAELAFRPLSEEAAR